jgi:hypothetical protein
LREDRSGEFGNSLSAWIKDQHKMIDKLQDGIDRLSQGCGIGPYRRKY